jgi:hypothetical protein
MNSKKQISLVTVVLCSFLSVVASISGLTTSEIFGQQQNTTNTTTTSTSSNLTQAAGPGPMADLTQSDFGELIDNLDSAREAIRDSDPAGALSDLGSAETELRVFMTQVGGENSTGGQQLLTILNQINAAQTASGNNETLDVFQRINRADIDLFNITQTLPAGDGDDGDDNND